MEKRMAKRKKRRREWKKREADNRDDSDGPGNQSDGAGVTEEEDDEENSSGLESAPGELAGSDDSEGETAYEQSFDGRVVRLGKAFVLRG